MSDVTRILSEIEKGNPGAAEQLLPVIYHELRALAAGRLAKERSDQTLQATDLVHEAYLRLVGSEQDRQWNNRGHFFAAAAEAMRRILVERARAKLQKKRGGEFQRQDLEHVNPADESQPELIVAVHEGLEKLAEEDARLAALVKLRCFAGLTITEAADALGVARSTAIDDWAYAKSWLRVLLCD